MLLKYEDFLRRVNELGYMFFSETLPGFPSLSAETPDENWHTGDPSTDPWIWKDRAAEKKDLAFGCILGGHKGFVSSRMYSVFYAAYRPREPMEERWASGAISRELWELWLVFQDKTLLSTSDIRQEMGVTKKKGGSKVDRAIRELQREYYITVAGNRRKIDKNGQPYGWPANVYDRVEDWTPADWRRLNPSLPCAKAREIILDVGAGLGRVTRQQIARKMGL